MNILNGVLVWGLCFLEDGFKFSPALAEPMKVLSGFEPKVDGR